MIQFSTVLAINDFLYSDENQKKNVGFVPTMGALHDGHLSLVSKSLSENDLTVVSIFVNPVQFNNQKDLEKYPRTLETDLKKLQDIGCDVVFTPNYNEVYP
ncbi:MAG: pantoate--beta-alanine ligase, partial [Bacteroidales bacterium]|nr:pantoate--beta-alanine ligase [Bacteroidales bacterium]